MSKMFQLCDSLHALYNALSYDEDSPCDWLLVPVAALHWRDEHPGEDAIPTCHSECSDSIARLFSARAEYWRSGGVGGDLEPVWAEAKRIIPAWPGFRRLTLSSRLRKAQENLEKEEKNMFMALFGDDDDVTIEDKGGGLA